MAVLSQKGEGFANEEAALITTNVKPTWMMMKATISPQVTAPDLPILLAKESLIERSLK